MNEMQNNLKKAKFGFGAWVIAKDTISIIG